MQQKRVAEQLTKIQEAAKEAEGALLSDDSARSPRLSRAGWEVQTMYLPGDLRKWLKLESVMQEKEIGEIVAEILREHLARRG